MIRRSLDAIDFNVVEPLAQLTNFCLDLLGAPLRGAQDGFRIHV
jgi:hypothetical protein